MCRAPLFIAHTNNKNMATASLLAEILACFIHCMYTGALEVAIS
jgi:hypothetical protein